MILCYQYGILLKKLQYTIILLEQNACHVRLYEVALKLAKAYLLAIIKYMYFSPGIKPM